LECPEWAAQIVARAGDSLDAANYFGVASVPRQFDVPAPPRFGSSVRLDLRRGSGEDGAYAAVFRSTSARKAAWEFSVYSAGVSEVTVSTPDLSAIPPDYGVVLTDEHTGRSTELRTVPTYRYAVSPEPSERVFRLTVRPRSSALVVSSLTAASTASGGAEVRFILTAEASCDLEVMNIAGRTVRRLANSRLYESGQQVISWSGRNDNGVPVPSGVYLVRVRARSAKGETAQSLSTVSIHR